NVYKLPPANFMHINLSNGEVEIKKYWSFEFNQKPSPTSDVGLEDGNDVAGKIYETVKDSVEHHMIADVPVGAFLSGGVDSSIITTLMQKIREDNPGTRAELGTGHRKVK